MDEFHRFKNKFGLGSSHRQSKQSSAPEGWTPIHYPAPPGSSWQPDQAPPYYPQPSHQSSYPSYPGQAPSYYGGSSQYSSAPAPPIPSQRPPADVDEQGYDMMHDRPPPTVSSSRPSQANPAVKSTSDTEAPSAGALYKAGRYPTPDLFPYAVTLRVLTLDSPQHGYTSESIQKALDGLGPNSTLYLPPKSRWKVSSTIWLKPRQEIATLRYPRSEDEIAWLDAEQCCNGHILSGANSEGVRIRNIGIDGGREKFGYNKENDAIVQLGNSKGHNQHIDHCMIRHPRQWSCLQVFQGAENVKVTNNLIGPAGYDEDSELEGSGKWADGISYAGQNGLVAGNRIEDATDGAIVVFGAPGTLVTSNTIVNCCRMGLGAINMVDYGPHDGNYEGTRIIHNTIVLDGAYIKIGIGQGPSVWFTPPDDRPRDYNRGAVVKYNLITTSGDEETGGSTMGYAFAVTDVDDWVCEDNEVHPSVDFGGNMSRVSRDPKHQSLGPGPFVALKSAEGRGPRSNSKLQQEFVHGPIGRLLDVRPGESSYRVFWPGQLSLGMGAKSITLKEIELAFDPDGTIRLRKGDVVWAMHAPGAANSSASLVFDAKSKHLIVVDLHRQVTLTDLTPSISASEEVYLALSDEHPHIVLGSTTTGAVHFAPTGYRADFQWQARVGDIVALGDGIVASLSRKGEYVISKSGTVLWRTHEAHGGEEDSLSHLIWQGDGNLVIYSGKDGHALWSNGSCGRSPAARYLVWSKEEPYLKCISEGGESVWTSSKGLVV